MNPSSRKQTYKTRESFKDVKRNPEAIQALKDLFTHSVISRFDKPLSASTVTNYVGKIERLCIECLGHGWNGDHRWLLDPENVIACIDRSTLSAKKDYLSGVIKLLKHIGADQSVIDTYLKAMSRFKNDEYDIRRNNKGSEKQVDDSLPLSEIRQKINDFVVKTPEDLADKLITMLFFSNNLVPRGGDLALLKYVSITKKPKDINKNFNYVTLDKLGCVVDMVWCFYKTRNTYGDCLRFDFTPEVRKIFNDYVKFYNGQAGEFVFTMANGKEFSKANFNDVIQNATEHVLGKRMTPNLIRSIQISDYYKNGLHTQNDDLAFAKKFIHSVDVSKDYLKTNLKGIADGDVDD